MERIGNRLDIETEFTILGVLGKGSFGIVYRARHLASQNVIALKKQTLKENNTELVREIQIMEQMSSPYVVGYYGSCLDGEVMWIVMELMCYGSINDMMTITKKVLNEYQIATVCSFVLQGLIYMESVHKLHRDIKPHNILVNEKGEAKLCDFGISSTITKGQKRSTVIGTPYYLAPEIITEKGYDNQADVWALGISAIEMAEFNPPLHDAHAMRVLFMIPLNPSPTLTDPEHWSKDFNSFLQCCLEKDPSARASARELLNHPFIISKSNPKTMFPYLEQTADYVNSHGGSLDEALKAVRLEPSDSDGEDCGLVLSDIDEAHLFQDFSDADADLGWDSEESLVSDISFEELSSSYSSLSDSTSDDTEYSDLSLDLTPKRPVKPEPSVSPVVVESLKEPEAITPRRTSFKTPHPVPKIAKIPLDSDEFKAMASKEINFGLLQSARKPKTLDGTPLSPRDTKRQSLTRKTEPKSPIVVLAAPPSPKVSTTTPAAPSPKMSLPLRLPTTAMTNSPTWPSSARKMMKDKEAHEVRKTLEDPEIDPHAEFVKVFPNHKTTKFDGCWNGFGTVKNPWRNNQQFKVNISKPTLVCIEVITPYTDKSYVGLHDYREGTGTVGVTVLSFNDAQSQVILKPRNTHSIHTWKNQTSGVRSVRMYFEDEEMTYVIVPTVTALGSACVDYRLQILYPNDTTLEAVRLSPLPSISIDGAWTEETAGGTIDGSDWRKNPQYMLSVQEDSTVYFFLAQMPPDPNTESNIGFYVFNAPEKCGLKKLLCVDNQNTIVKEQYWRKVSEATTSKKVLLPKGDYIVIPCTFYPRNKGAFRLTAATPGNLAFSFKEMDNKIHSVVLNSKWTHPSQPSSPRSPVIPLNLCGGCVQNDGWRNNPMFHLTTTGHLQSILLFLDRKPWSRSTDRPFIGLYIFKAEEHETQGLMKANLVSKSDKFSDAKEVYLRAKLPRGSYIIIPCTFAPGFVGSFMLQAYSSTPFALKYLPVAPRVSVADTWTERNSGGVFKFHSWRKNPQYLLQAEPKAVGNKVEVVLEQDRIPDVPDAFPFMGFYVIKPLPESLTSNAKLLEIAKPQEQVMKITEFIPGSRQTWNTTLTAEPLIIMPTPYNPGTLNSFRLFVSGVTEELCSLKKLKACYKLYTHNSAWSQAKHTAGGCHNFSLGQEQEKFLDNPSILLLPPHSKTTVTVILKQDANKEQLTAGIYILEKKMNLGLSKRSVIGHSQFVKSPEITYTCSLKQNQAYVIVLAAFNPGEENEITVEMYSTKDFGQGFRPLK